MSSSAVDQQPGLDVSATRVSVTDETLTVELSDGRTITVPTAWYPRLLHGTAKERGNVELGGYGIRWPDLDEDISVRGLLLGNKSGENPAIIKYWLEQRAKGRRVTFQDYMREKHKPGTKRGKRKTG